MKKYIFTLILALAPWAFANAASDYYLKIDGVEGESTTSTSSSQGDPDRPIINGQITTTPTEPQEGSVDAFLKIDTIEGESANSAGGTEDINIGVGEQKKGNVEFEWKVEEGESAPGVEPDEIDVNDDGEEGRANDRLVNAGPKSGWPTGGVSVAMGDVNGLSDDEKIELLATIKAWAEVKSEQDLKNFATGILLEDDRPAETLSLNYEKIKFTHKVSAKFLGLFKGSLTANTEVGPDFKVKVKFPWYAFLFSKSVKSGEFEEAITTELSSAAPSPEAQIEGETWSYSTTARVMELVSNVLKTKHDTAKNSIGNIR